MLNVYPDQLQNHVYLAHQALANPDLLVSAEAIKNKYLDKVDHTHTINEDIKLSGST
jgi:hypothetical protein